MAQPGEVSPEERRRLRLLLCGAGSARLPSRIPRGGVSCSRGAACASCTTSFPSAALSVFCARRPTCFTCPHHGCDEGLRTAQPRLSSTHVAATSGAVRCCRQLSRPAVSVQGLAAKCSSFGAARHLATSLGRLRGSPDLHLCTGLNLRIRSPPSVGKLCKLPKSLRLTCELYPL